MSRPLLFAALELIVTVAVVALYLQLRDGGPQRGLRSLRFEREGREITVVSSVQTGEVGLFELALDWGDGRSELLPVEGTALQVVRSTHTYAADGSYQVQLSATFEDGSASVRRRTVVIAPETAATPRPTARPAVTARPSPARSPEASPVAGAEPQAMPAVEPTEEPTPESTDTPEPTETPQPTATTEPQPTPPPGNQPPEVFIVELAPQAAFAVTLTAVATDAEGALIAVAIDWGDGHSQELAAPGSNLTQSHSYAARASTR